MTVDINKDTLLEFPCDYAVKTFGTKDSEVRAVTIESIERYIDSGQAVSVTENLSRNGKYIAITARFTATSKPQLDNIYQLLSDHPAVTMAL